MTFVKPEFKPEVKTEVNGTIESDDENIPRREAMKKERNTIFQQIPKTVKAFKLGRVCAVGICRKISHFTGPHLI